MKKVFFLSLVLCLAVSLGFASDFTNKGKTNFTAVGTHESSFMATEYAYDDGGTEDALGLTSGGQIMWIQWFDVLPGKDTITEISTAWGSAGGSIMPDGTAAYVYLYDDLNNDGDPSDCVLLASVATTVQGGGTDAFTVIDIPDTVVSGKFFIGASCDQDAGTYMAPLDQSTVTGGQAWVVGDTTSNLDANDLTNNDVPPTNLQAIGFDSYLLSRATYFGVSLPLEASTNLIVGADGGTVDFDLTAGIANANKDFLILATGSGTVPGIDLPGGGNLPINWDAKTDMILGLTMGGSPNFPLYGTLDADGNASVTMTIQRKVRYTDIDLHFAYTVDTLDWASNAVNLFIEGEEPLGPEYAYDDGGTEDALGLTSGGQIMWIQWFDTVPGKDTITEIKTAWGSVGGSVMPDGTAGYVYLYDDLNNDGDPSDCVLLASVATTVQGGGTDAFTVVDIPDTVVSGKFFIGASCDQTAGTYMAPLDQSTVTGGEAWVVGDTTSNLDANDLTNNDVPPTNLQAIGFDSYLLSRAPYL